MIASGFAAFMRSRAKVATVRTVPTSFPWFLEVDRPQRIRKLVVMPYPRAALPAAGDVYPETILAAMRQAVAQVFGYSMTRTMSPAPTVSPSLTLISFTTPLFSALIWFSIFIASSTTTAAPASTL